MCEALRELMWDEISQGINQGIAQGISQGISQGEQKKLLELIRKKIPKGKSLEQIADELEETTDSILPLYNQVLETL